MCGQVKSTSTPTNALVNVVRVWPTALLYYGYCIATVIDSVALPGSRDSRATAIASEFFGPRIVNRTYIVVSAPFPFCRRQPPRRSPSVATVPVTYNYFGSKSVPPAAGRIAEPRAANQPFPVRAAVSEKPIVPFQQRTSLNTLFQQYPAVAVAHTGEQLAKQRCQMQSYRRNRRRSLI